MRLLLISFLFTMGIFYGVECKANPDKDALLVVVDMQGGFPSSQSDPDVVDHVKKLIEKSMKKNKKIIFLEYDCHGATLSSLTKACSNYSEKFFVTKYENDGSQNILEFLKEQAIDKDNLQKISVCGVNTPYCVQSTVEGLRGLIDPQVKIIVEGDACNSVDLHFHEQDTAFSEMSKLENVKVKNPHGSFVLKKTQKKHPSIDRGIIIKLLENRIDVDVALEFISACPEVSIQDILNLKKKFVDIKIAYQFKQLFPEASLSDILKIEASYLNLGEALSFKQDFPETTLKFILNLTKSNYDISYFRDHPEQMASFSE